MSEDITLEAEKKKYLGKEATEKLIKNIKSKVNNALADKVSFNEQTLTNEQQEQVRKNIGVMQADHAQNDKYAVDYIKNRLAYTEENLITVCFGDVDNSQFTVSDVGFSHVSDLVPTKEQLVGNMRFYLVDQFGEESESHDLYIKEAIFDDDMVYGGALDYGNDILSGMYVSVAYKSGVWNGMEIPKTGLFIHKPDLGEADPNAYFELKYEAVHGVDPKYLPEGGFGYDSGYKYVTVLDDKMTLTGNTPGANSQWSGAGTSLIEVGKTYRVTLDGGREYECVCRRYNKGIDNDVSDFRFLGDLSGLGHEGYGDEDKPFLFFEAHSNSFGIIQQCFDDAGGLTIKIEERQRDIHLIDPKFLPEGGVGYTETETIYNAKNLALPAGSQKNVFDFTSPIVEGESYIVNLNGVEYEYICVLNSSGAPCLGNIAATGDGNSVNNGEPVGVKFRATGKYIVATIDTSVDRTISVYQRTETIRPIDPKFLPDTVATKADIFGAMEASY